VAKEAGGKTGPAGVKYLGWLTIAFMTVSCVASIRNTPSMAIYGWASVFLYLVPAIVFLIPTALIAAELASGWEGGPYRWIGEAMGPKTGFVGVWAQFAMTIPYYPSLLASVAATFAYVINPDLASSGVYTAIVILVLYWVATLVSFRGLSASAILSSGGMVIGTLIPGVTLVALGIAYLFGGGTNEAAGTSFLPPWTGIASLVLIVGNFLSFAGMEVNAVHVNKLREPGKEFPRAIFLASGMALLIFILPALAISFVVPRDQLTLTAGVMQAFQQFFEYFNVSWLTPIFAVMIVCAMLGGMMGWLAGPSRGLLMIGRQQGFLPPFLQKTNHNGIQSNILIAQGVIVSAIALLFALIPSVSSAFWILSAMTTQVYLIMYVLMFIAVIKLRRLQPDVPRGYRCPAVWVVGSVGLVSSICCFVIGLIPPSQFGTGSVWAYAGLMLAGTFIIGLAIPLLFLWRRKPTWIAPAEAGGEKPEPAGEPGPIPAAPEGSAS
jgi:putative glutamate/gamma-aminobutyrate antiporter